MCSIGDPLEVRMDTHGTAGVHSTQAQFISDSLINNLQECDKGSTQYVDAQVDLHRLCRELMACVNWKWSDLTQPGCET